MYLCLESSQLGFTGVRFGSQLFEKRNSLGDVQSAAFIGTFGSLAHRLQPRIEILQLNAVLVHCSLHIRLFLNHLRHLTINNKQLVTFDIIRVFFLALFRKRGHSPHMQVFMI